MNILHFILDIFRRSLDKVCLNDDGGICTNDDDEYVEVE